MTASRESFQERLHARLEKFSITATPQQSRQLEAYYSLLSKWNARINLTSLDLAGFPAATLDRLLVEPLRASRFVEDSPVWFDLGSGGGSPAIPLKVLRPAARLTMVESVTKKGAFLREAVHAVGLSGTNVLTCRVETLSRETQPASVDLVTLRAIKLNEGILSSIHDLLKPNGRFIWFGAHPGVLDGFQPVTTQPLVAPGDMLAVYKR